MGGCFGKPGRAPPAQVQILHKANTIFNKIDTGNKRQLTK